MNAALLDDDRKETLRAAVTKLDDDMIELAAALVRCRSVLGAEEEAQQLVGERLRAAGFELHRVQPNAADALADPNAGYPPMDYGGRTSVVAVRPGSGGGRSLHLSGHIDVVPVDEAEAWQRDPWSGAVGDGRLWGRGAGDMKAGLAAYITAAQAVAEVCTDLRGDLIFSSVIEEECGGNGMWSVLRAGYTADATMIGEATGLTLGHGGTGVVWARLAAKGQAGHAAFGGRGGPFDQLSTAISRLRDLETAMNQSVSDPVFAAASDWPYSLTVGRIEGGVWTASAPAELVAYVRCGFGRDIEPEVMQSRIRDSVTTAVPNVDVTFECFRARAYCHDSTGEFARTVSSAHQFIRGVTPETTVFTATTDARFITKGECLCYGPIAFNLHGKDESVDLESVRQTALVAAYVAAAWLR